MTFYETLSNLMKSSQLTAKQLSETLKIGKNQFKYWKDNGNIPNGETLIALADYFGVSVDYLLGRSEAIKKEPAADGQAQTGTLQQIGDEYGQSSREAFTMYIQLDSDDKGEIRGEMKQMLKSDKYSAKDKLKHA